MDNQHKMISGYRDLTLAEIILMNEAKQLEAQVLAFHAKVECLLTSAAAEVQHNRIGLSAAEKEVAQGEKLRIERAQPFRWLAIARTDTQTSFMAVVRAIAQPQPIDA